MEADLRWMDAGQAVSRDSSSAIGGRKPEPEISRAQSSSIRGRQRMSYQEKVCDLMAENDKLVAENNRLRVALDKIIGVSLGRAEFPAALVHRIAHDALGNVEQQQEGRPISSVDHRESEGQDAK